MHISRYKDKLKNRKEINSRISINNNIKKWEKKFFILFLLLPSLTTLFFYLRLDLPWEARGDVLLGVDLDGVGVDDGGRGGGLHRQEGLNTKVRYRSQDS